MTCVKFDYLRDGPPEAIEHAREFSRRADARALLSFLGTAAAILLCAWMLEEAHVREARAALFQAQARLDRTAAKANVVRAGMERLRRAVGLERRLELIRDTSALVARRMTMLANRLPPEAWLTSLTWNDGGYDVQGRGIGIRSIAQALRAYAGGRLVALRASENTMSKLLEFRMHIPTQ